MGGVLKNSQQILRAGAPVTKTGGFRDLTRIVALVERATERSTELARIPHGNQLSQERVRHNVGNAANVGRYHTPTGNECLDHDIRRAFGPARESEQIRRSEPGSDFVMVSSPNEMSVQRMLENEAFVTPPRDAIANQNQTSI